MHQPKPGRRRHTFADTRNDPAMPCAALRFDWAQASHSGLKRTQNQDSYGVAQRFGLCLVADGMGGHAHGALASALARDCITSAIAGGCDLNQAITEANEEIERQATQQVETRKMGTTVVALQVSGAQFDLAWVGDSRCYLRQNDQLTQLSIDHSLVQELRSAGVLSAEQARTSRYRNLLTQALGVTRSAQLQIGKLRGQLFAGMQFLLCSDGLNNEVPDADIARILAVEHSAQSAADALIAAALQGGGSDNVTVVVLRIEG